MLAFLVLLPMLSLRVLHSDPEMLRSKECKDKWLNMYKDIKLTENNQIYYFPVFLVRRLLYAFIPVLLSRYPYMKLHIFSLFSLFYIIFYASTNPHDTEKRFRIELTNEALLMVIVYHFLSFRNSHEH